MQTAQAKGGLPKTGVWYSITGKKSQGKGFTGEQKKKSGGGKMRGINSDQRRMLGLSRKDYEEVPWWVSRHVKGKWGKEPPAKKMGLLPHSAAGQQVRSNVRKDLRKKKI